MPSDQTQNHSPISIIEARPENLLFGVQVKHELDSTRLFFGCVGFIAGLQKAQLNLLETRWKGKATAVSVVHRLDTIKNMTKLLS